MNKEISCGAIIFRKNNKEMQFLLIYSKRNNAWGFPKGHIEPGESEKEAALREIKEETGIDDLAFVEGFREEDIYKAISNRGPHNGTAIEKHSIYYLCKTQTSVIKVDEEEISSFKWLRLQDVYSVEMHKSTKQILTVAVDFLLKQ